MRHVVWQDFMALGSIIGIILMCWLEGREKPEPITPPDYLSSFTYYT